jgi:type IV pilus assembly protein PilA
MYQNLRKRTEGFTIIEVLIVLAIAGLILLIVFLAVPALQRNSRNNSRRNDSSRISSAVTEFINNNNGSPPTNWGQIKPYIGSMGFYTSLPADATAISSASANQTVTDANTVPAVATSATCQTSGGNSGTAATGGTSRQFVVLYKVETGGADTPQCISS